MHCWRDEHARCRCVSGPIGIDKYKAGLEEYSHVTVVFVGIYIVLMIPMLIPFNPRKKQNRHVFLEILQIKSLGAPVGRGVGPSVGIAGKHGRGQEFNDSKARYRNLWLQKIPIQWRSARPGIRTMSLIFQFCR